MDEERGAIQKSVSIIIPCYNAERWIGEAVDSCLRQTYRPVEIIVIDDGSTDGGGEVLRSFGARIGWESGPRRGACYARNRGFELSRGGYIQFLDADDYLEPDKLARQVAFLESTGADVVYGDWRHQYHTSVGEVVRGEVQVSGDRADILEALLGGWWTANMTLLMRREVVRRCGGWDETLDAAQDRCFFISIALTGARVSYQPGCCSVYRRYGDVTVSTASLARWLENHWQILNRTEARLIEAGRFAPCYRRALAQSYFSLARNYFDLDRPRYEQALKKALAHDPEFRPAGSFLYRSIQRVLGFELADRLASGKRRVLKTLQDTR